MPRSKSFDFNPGPAGERACTTHHSPGNMNRDVAKELIKKLKNAQIIKKNDMLRDNITLQ